jgi:hypothetical protein
MILLIFSILDNLEFIWNCDAAAHRHLPIALFNSIRFIPIVKSSFSKAAHLILVYQRAGGQTY